MRDFSWNVFTKTGDLDAYMLYKQSGEGEAVDPGMDVEETDEDHTDLINY